MSDHPSIELFKKCDKIMEGHYIKDVVDPVPEQLGCTAFFPGGYGLWLKGGNNRPDTLPAFPVNGIMMLADIFDPYEAYFKLRDEYNLSKNIQCSNIYGKFWNGLQDIIEQSKCRFESIFFSNVYMGIFKCDKPYFHKKAKISKEYIDRCNDFLFQQIIMQRPRLIFAIGLKSADCLGSLFKVQEWRKPSIASMNNNSTFFEAITHGDIRFNLGYIADTTYKVNENKRKYGGYNGRKANVKFFTEALSLSNMS